MEIIFALVAVGFVVLVGAVVINRVTPGSEPLVKFEPGLPSETESLNGNGWATDNPLVD